MEATRRHPLAQLDLKAVVRTYADNPQEDDDGLGLVPRPDLVVAEVRRTERGWEVYGRPTTRPDSGQRVRALVPGPDVELVAQEDDLGEIRKALASYLTRPPVERGSAEAHPTASPDVAVLNLTPATLTLTVMVRGVAWRVTL